MKKLLITLLMTVALLLPQTLKAAGYTGREAGWLTDTDGTYTAIPGIQFVFFNEANFPDPTFRSALMDLYSNYGFKRYGQAVCPQHLPYVEILNRNISDFKGIEFFTNAKVINIASCQATKLDLTHNTALTWLRCSSNNLTSLTLPNTTTLTFVDCNNNHLVELDLSKNTALTSLYCGSNTLTELDVSANAALQTLDCWGCQLTTLDVTQNTVLIELSCANNQLTGLDVTQNTMLNKLSFTGNMLTEIDLSNNDALTFLQCGYNKLTTLNLTGNTKLETLDCASQINRSLKQLTLPNTTTLTDARCHGNSLTTLDVSNNTGLTALDCSTNNLVELDLSANTALTTLYYTNQTRDIDAESTEIPVVKNGQTVYKKCYYLRLDNNKTGEEKTIVERMTETNHGGVESSFDLGRVRSWTGGGIIIEGTKRAASVGEVTPDMVYGTILMLTNVTESGDVASGWVNYKYNVQNTLDSDGSKGGFTLRWTASAKSGVVTGVLRLGDGVEVPVSEVQFVNPAGQVSDRPWPGVNIVVKRYADGTVTTGKQLK